MIINHINRKTFCAETFQFNAKTMFENCFEQRIYINVLVADILDAFVKYTFLSPDGDSETIMQCCKPSFFVVKLN